MEKEFVPYELAVKLKELGFDEPCFAYYNGYKELDHLMPERVVVGRNYNGDTITSAPLYQQAFRWFREKHGLIGQPIPLSISYPGKVTHYGWSIVSNQNSNYWENENDRFKSYEEAESACLDKLIEIVRLTKS